MYYENGWKVFATNDRAECRILSEHCSKEEAMDALVDFLKTKKKREAAAV